MIPYALPEAAVSQLETLVARIESNPGNLINPNEFETRLDTRNVLKSLPEGMSDKDLIGVLELAFFTECATDTYADAITARANVYGAPWLSYFTNEIWKPDEYSHAEPFKLMLMGLGFSEADLDARAAEVQGKSFEHVGGDTPAHVTTFGMVQEYLTDRWHGHIGNLLKESLPAGSRMANRIKQRETLHTVWYRQMTAIQVGARPELVKDVSYELAHFRLPGNSLIPEIQGQAEKWLHIMHNDFDRMGKDLIRLVYQTVESPLMLGRLAIELTDARGQSFKGLHPKFLRMVLERRSGWGYALVGEALLESAGLGFMFKTERDTNRDGSPNMRERIRAAVRSWLASKMPPAFSTSAA